VLGEGNVIVAFEADKETGRQGDNQSEEVAAAPAAGDILLSAHYACTYCDKSYEPPSPQLFSFNSPQGMCPDCDGLGTRFSFDPDLLVPDPSLSFYEGAFPLIGPLRGMGRWRKHTYEGVAKSLGVDLKKPWRD